MKIKKSPYKSTMGGDIDVEFWTEGGEYRFNLLANMSRRNLRDIRRAIKRYLNETRNQK